MPTIEEVALELAVFKLVDHSIDKGTYDLTFKTRTTNGFESTTVVASNNPDYHKIVSLIVMKAYDHSTNNVSTSQARTTKSNQGGTSTCSLPKESAIIVYDREFNDYTHNGDLIIDLNMFIAKCLELKMPINIKELSWYIFQSLSKQ